MKNMNKIVFRLIVIFTISLFYIQQQPKIVQAKIIPNTTIYAKEEYYQGQEIVDQALKFLGAPYKYGGNSLTKGIDCSHFVWNILKNTNFYSGKYHPSRTFLSIGIPVSSIAQAKPGDIIVYSHHVAIYDGYEKIIQALSNGSGVSYIRRYDHAKILGIRRFLKDKVN